jgi:hypothetical protein
MKAEPRSNEVGDGISFRVSVFLFVRFRVGSWFQVLPASRAGTTNSHELTRNKKGTRKPRKRPSVPTFQTYKPRSQLRTLTEVLHPYLLFCSCEFVVTYWFQPVGFRTWNHEPTRTYTNNNGDTKTHKKEHEFNRRVSSQRLLPRAPFQKDRSTSTRLSRSCPPTRWPDNSPLRKISRSSRR